jgi:hypothetical protein
MRVLAAHGQQVRMTLEVPPAGGRLVMRQHAGRAAAGPVVMQGTMRSGPLKAFSEHLTPASEPTTPCGSCRVRLHPRADPALTACLLSLLKWRLDADAIKANKKHKPEKGSGGVRGLLKLRSGGKAGSSGLQPGPVLPAKEAAEAEATTPAAPAAAAPTTPMSKPSAALE